MTNEMLKDVFDRLADEARPVDGMADRALRRLDDRRRNVRLTGAALAIAAAVTVPFTVLGGDGEPSPSRPGTVAVQPRLPTDTAEEAKATRSCMRGGAPTGGMGEPRPELGKLADFRLLARERLRDQYVALVGSERGFVLCAATYGFENGEPPMFEAWPSTPPGRLWDFAEPMRVDAFRAVTRAEAGGTSVNGLHLVVVGRVKATVVRVTVTWNGGRSARAVVGDGFFLARSDSEMVPDRNAKGPMSEGAMKQPDDRITQVAGYDARGARVFLWQPNGGKRAFSPGSGS